MEINDEAGPDEEEEEAKAEAETRARAEETLARIEERKAEGNSRFKTGDLEAALEAYDDAMALLQGHGAPTLHAAIASNQALCLLKLERFSEAEARASAALHHDIGNGKAAYRRGCARLRLGDGAGAMEDLAKASRLEPNNRDVADKLEEARQLAATPVAKEIAMATGATGAIGSTENGLYADKPDLNEGRLAETHKEQRDWIGTITDWREITDIAFAEEEEKAQVSVYMTLPGVHQITSNKVCVWFTATTLEVRVIDLNGTNWMYIAQELWGQIDPEHSSYKIRKDKLSIKLGKRQSARSWDKWEKLRRI